MANDIIARAMAASALQAKINVDKEIADVNQRMDEMSNEMSIMSENISKIDSVTEHNNQDIATMNTKINKMEQKIDVLIDVVEITEWKDIQTIVRSGMASEIFSVGDQLMVKKDDKMLTFDIIGIDYDVPSDPQYTHSMTLQLHDCYDTLIPYDAIEATWYVQEFELSTVGPWDGLPIGTYYFTTAGGTSYNFTTTQVVPVGGQIVFNFNSTITIYDTKGGTNVLETLTVSPGVAGSLLSILQNNYNSANLLLGNAEYRTRYGSNNWLESWVRQWLNTDKSAGTWWQPQSDYDRPVNTDIDGFLKGVDPDFINVLGLVKKSTWSSILEQHDNVYIIDSTELFFLLDDDESYAYDVRLHGSYAYYKDFSDLSMPGSQTDGNRVKYSNGVAVNWYTRNPSDGYSSRINTFSTEGALVGSASYSTAGVSPCCCIV